MSQIVADFDGDKLSQKKRMRKINGIINDSSAVQSKDLIVEAGSCLLNSKEHIK